MLEGLQTLHYPQGNTLSGRKKRTEESALFSDSIQLEIGLQITVILNKYGSHRRGLKGGLWAHRLC